MIRWHQTPGGNARLAQADCLRALADAPADWTFDAVVADPPYCSGGATVAESTRAMSQGTNKGKAWFEGDAMGPAGLAWLLRETCRASLERLAPGGSIFMFADWRMFSIVGPACESAGLRLRNLIVWDKGSPSRGLGFRPQHELILHLTNRRSEFHRFDLGNVLRFPRPKRNGKAHPTEKPVDLLSALIETSAPVGGLVFDPFAGSGSTGAAALATGRRFVGVERDARFVGPALRRLAALDPGPTDDAAALAA